MFWRGIGNEIYGSSNALHIIGFWRYGGEAQASRGKLTGFVMG